MCALFANPAIEPTRQTGGKNDRWIARSIHGRDLLTSILMSALLVQTISVFVAAFGSGAFTRAGGVRTGCAHRAASQRSHHMPAGAGRTTTWQGQDNRAVTNGPHYRRPRAGFGRRRPGCLARHQQLQAAIGVTR